MRKETTLIPRKVLFGNPEKATPKVSPDGTRIAYLAPADGVLNVWVRTIGADDDKQVTADKDRGVRIYFWAHDASHILYLQDKGGNENWRLFGVNLDSGKVKDYTPFDNVQVRVVGIDKHFPNDMLLGINKENPRLHDVYHLDLLSGYLTLIEKNPGNVIGWIPDTKLKIRAALAARRDGGFDLLVRKNTKSKWKTLLVWSIEDNKTSSPLGFTNDGKYIYLQDSRNANTSRLVKMEISTGKMDVIAEDPTYDVSGVMVHPDTHEVQAVTFFKARKEMTVLDDAIADDVNSIKELDDGDVSIYNRDHADNIWLVGFAKDTGPVPYFTWDRGKKEATFLFNHMPALADYELAPMEPFSFHARDGLTIHGYLTFPPDKDRKDLPAVLLVHGGPWSRDRWGYDPQAQWLANRGYLCIQVNFRGSTGYGKDFVNAGDKEWAGKVHNDLIDGVKWTVDQGYTDKDKVAIFGGSYGGYAALVGATFTPDFFACAVDLVGPSNLVTLIKSIPPYWTPLLNDFYKRMGHPEKDREFLESRSPLFKVDNIKIPMLVAQGANDPRVKKAEADQVVEAMKKKGLDHQYMVFSDEGHGFAKPENRMKFYAAAEKFLAKHLGGRDEE